MTTKWFGKSWDAPVCDNEQVPTPIGQQCPVCEMPIQAGDQGISLPFIEKDITRLPYHLDCFLHEIGVGPCTHIRGDHG